MTAAGRKPCGPFAIVLSGSFRQTRDGLRTELMITLPYGSLDRAAGILPAHVQHFAANR